MDNIESVIQEYLNECSGRSLSPNTVRMYRDSLSMFTRWAAQEGLEGLSSITVQHLRQYAAASLLEVSPGATHARLRPLKSFLKWCVVEEILKDDPSKRLKMPKIPDPELKVVKPAVFKKLLAQSKLGNKPLRDQAILTVLFDSGLRASELCSLRLGDIDTSGYLRVIHGKGGKGRMVPVSRETIRVIRAYTTNERPETSLPYLFLLNEDEGMKANSLNKLLYRLCKGAGIENYSAHAFRRGMAVQFIRNGGDQFALQRIFGHASLHITNIYARLGSEDLKDIHRRASPLTGLE